MSTTLTLERMRADIAAMLHEDPSEIADDDNLMDWGLDSMRAMTLASRWRDAGARIEFSQMAEDATLSHWWSLISAHTAS
ncbi:phosphopantetheine-binding protein [Paenalcaligenes suwonensis]|uniref:phosphopantetheine-binding protein n=1 Tax=Paenalcaligenes suwonensis TaxID=1202713 RepID=UPI00140A54A1|nr:phosphopantetheine-binding protein [Paenalcaligenes suwonensis]NHC60894.1 phosphopantetheine-binding protein [Paenalcaligenes suwonensis]